LGQPTLCDFRSQVLAIIRVMIGDWLRLDHAYGIQMANAASAHPCAAILLAAPFELCVVGDESCR
jgi:hypothetical protein